eukprot:5710887-Pyramimonas_sp.AAC.1
MVYTPSSRDSRAGGPELEGRGEGQARVATEPARVLPRLEPHPSAAAVPGRKRTHGDIVHGVARRGAAGADEKGNDDVGPIAVAQ